MKLLGKYRRFTYSSLCLVVTVGFIVDYYIFRNTIHRTTDDVLNEYRIDIEEYADEHKTLQPLIAVNSKFGQIIPVDNVYAVQGIDAVIVDTLVYSHYQEEKTVYRKLFFPVITDNQHYIVKLMLPSFEEDDLLQSVFLALFIFVVLFIALTYLIDISFTSQILKPFYKILDTVRTYEIDRRSKVTFEASDIDEFQDLRRFLQDMMNKINSDFYEMKEFLEYTSHEIQTPLSIIQLKLDVLNQYNIQNNEALDCIQSIEIALKRVVRFNRTILFITKIKNDLYVKGKLINLKLTIHQCFNELEELLSAKKITYSYGKVEDFVLLLHPFLADHLVQNILINAIKHNCEGGHIQVDISSKKLTITNTFDGFVPVGNIFEKYNHSSDNKGSSGLGLSIVKAICEKNNIGLQYQIKGDKFSIMLFANT